MSKKIMERKEKDRKEKINELEKKAIIDKDGGLYWVVKYRTNNSSGVNLSMSEGLAGIIMFLIKCLSPQIS